MLLRLIVLVSILIGPTFAFAFDQPKGVSNLPEVTKAWVRAGAKFFHLAKNRTTGDPHFFTLPIQKNKQTEQFDFENPLPLFSISNWKRETHDKLPSPNRPFGLWIEDTNFVDDDLPSIIKHSHLSFILLFDTNTSRQGISSLSVLPHLNHLSYFKMMPIRPRTINDQTRFNFRGFQSLKEHRLNVGIHKLHRDECESMSNLQLTCLSLERFNATKDDLAPLSQFREMKHLNLGFRSLSSQDLPAFPNDTALISLNIQLQELESLNKFGSVKKLRKVRLNAPSIRDDALASLGHSECLEDLHIFGCDQPLHGLKKLPMMKSLTRLTVLSCQWDSEGLSSLKSMPNLTELICPNNKFSGDALIHLQSCPKIESLSLSRNQIADDSLIHLTSLPNLKILDLSRTSVTDRGLETIVKHKRIESLNLSGLSLSDFNIGKLGQLQAIRQLTLSGQVLDAGIQSIGPLPSLERLSLNDSQVKARFLDDPKRFPQLKTLSLVNTQVTDESVPSLAKQAGLENIYLRNTKISDGVLQELKKALPRCNIFYE